jgi:hypothetical protein
VISWKNFYELECTSHPNPIFFLPMIWKPYEPSKSSELLGGCIPVKRKGIADVRLDYHYPLVKKEQMIYPGSRRIRLDWCTSMSACVSYLSGWAALVWVSCKCSSGLVRVLWTHTSLRAMDRLLVEIHRNWELRDGATRKVITNSRKRKRKVNTNEEYKQINA